MPERQKEKKIQVGDRASSVTFLNSLPQKKQTLFLDYVWKTSVKKVRARAKLEEVCPWGGGVQKHVELNLFISMRETTFSIGLGVANVSEKSYR